MFRVTLHKVSNYDQNVFVNNPRSEFYLSTSQEVCNLITLLPKGWFLSLLEFDFDSVDGIFSEFNFNS